MKSKYFGLIALLIFLSANIFTANAQTPFPSTEKHSPGVVEEFSSVEEAISWLNQRGLDTTDLNINVLSAGSTPMTLATVDNCNPDPIVRNPDHDYPLDGNTSEAIVFNGLWCASENVINLQVGTDWWGYNGLEAHEWGFITLRDADSSVLITVYAFDLLGIPDLDQVAIQETISHQFALCQPQVRVEWEANLQMEGSDGIATKTQSSVFTPECGEVILEKSGNPIVGTTWELIQIHSDLTRELVDRIEIQPYHLQERDGKYVAVIAWNELAGPVDAQGETNYVLQERIDLLEKFFTPRDLDTDKDAWQWEISLDATHQKATIHAYNPLHQIFLPICFKSGPDGEPVETPCPQDIADVLINGVLIRQNDATTKEGFAYALPTLHLQSTLEFRLGKLLDAGFIPQLVQLYVDAKPYGSYDVTRSSHIFTTQISGGDERNYQLNAYKIYIFHIQVLVGYEEDESPIYCYLRYLFYVDP